MIPLEVSFNLGLPGFITPYAGVGMGYYFIDNPDIDDATGYFGQVGVEFSIVKIGVMVELRYMDIEGEYFDDLALNAGILLRF
jgi:outer membrane protein W